MLHLIPTGFLNMHIAWMLFIMGLYHGINPAMGWLLAVALALKKKSYKILFFALLCMTLGHLTAIGMVVFGFNWLTHYISHDQLRWFTIILLVIFGIYHLFRQQHPSWFGMDVGYFQIYLWSLLIASAHGAGLMVLPIIFKSSPLTLIDFYFYITIHTLGYLTAALIVSTLLFTTLKFSVLKKAWINFDLLWAIALLISAVVIYFL